ncbi:hypothetical protein QE152_g29574 [Popillia japonica]|uniref:Uncharacterized protein n=1 Tax=Popillia japonica TaxID=7064 RepID=A0AAW1JHJ4_POPJA
MAPKRMTVIISSSDLQQLSNEALKPAKLERHLKTVHSNLSDRPPEFFAGKLENLKKMKLGKTGAAYETLVKPCLIKAVQQVLGVQASKKIQDIPLSNNTVKARIDTMSNDIEDQLVFPLSNNTVKARIDTMSNDIEDQLVCELKSLHISVCSVTKVPTKQQHNYGRTVNIPRVGNNIERKIICDYFERHGIEWKRLAGFCTDGAPAMLGSRSGLATLVKEKNPSTVTTHCIIHRQALASKTLPVDLSNTMKLAIKMVNAVKSSALNSHIFRKICAALDSVYE